MIDIAIAYLRAGLCVLPAILAEKRPALSAWKQYQKRLPTERQIRTWFAEPRPVCVLTGAVSGHLEMIDFDHGGELYNRWVELVTTESPELLARLIFERSQSGGWHAVYRCAEPVPGNRRLAQRIVAVPSAEPVVIAGKWYVPRKVGDRFEVTCTLIETRGEGGLFLCSPTAGYQLEQGSFEDIVVLEAAERAILIEAACALNEVMPPAERHRAGPGRSPRSGLPLPGDDFNERGDVREVLQRHGWQLVRGGENEYWRRPGKEQGWSATLRNGVLYVFSSNAVPFEPDRAYAPFSVYALLEHGGDFPAAAAALRASGYGSDADAGDVDLSHFLCRGAPVPTTPAAPEHPDPGPMPPEFYRVPGFISEVMDHCLATAPYPNVPLAFCGALALQAVLAGRKVRDQADNRSNLYILALAYSSVGKDWPRKVNTFILHRVGLIESLGEKFASGEGIQDSLFRTPAMLFQTDEIDGLLQSINKAHDARHENILGTLLTMYSAANSIFPMRRKAGKESPGVIDQPCLVVYGTAIPTHYYEALSERMLTNGFFARMLIVESGTRSAGQEPGIIDPPPRVMEAAQWWADFCPGTGNLEKFHPQPRIVEADDDARVLLTEARRASEAEYAAAEARGNPVGTTVWGRVPEQIRKLALLYAVSESHASPRITAAAARWATEFIQHQTRRMLFMA
ncbi:MAG TPA: bifunctional DNA primase/polymerase, partial [Phycisphaerae bacterium]|nr:bifunctional DNA primase/polymerase [Phycisphaerae bacterium]